MDRLCDDAAGHEGSTLVEAAGTAACFGSEEREIYGGDEAV